MVNDLIQRSGGKDSARHGVIFLDEADKLAAHAGNAHRADYCRGTQYSLLRLIEGAVVNLQSGDTMSTSGILFLFGGAFVGLNSRDSEALFQRHMGFERDVAPRGQTEAPTLEDFVSFGMERELMGRIGRCVPLQGLTGDDLRRILTESDQPVFRAYQDFFRSKGRELMLDDDAAQALVDKALARGMGARGLNALLEEWVQPKLLMLAEANHERD